MLLRRNRTNIEAYIPLKIIRQFERGNPIDAKLYPVNPVTNTLIRYATKNLGSNFNSCFNPNVFSMA